jgi:hypothetical protein
MKTRSFLIALMMLLCGSGSVPLHAKALDSTFSTAYTMDARRTNLNWVVCGSTQTTEGCYGSGSLGPFGRVGALIEGNPAQNLTNGTVTRYIYVLDVEYGSVGTGVALYVYKKIDTITVSDDTITVTLFKTVSLPLTGGTNTVASLAASPTFLYVGTNQDELAVQVKKSNFAIIQFGEISGPSVVNAITADQYGYVTVTWKTPDGSEGFYVFAPNGAGQTDGGGGWFMLNTLQGVQPSTLP